MDEDKDEDAKIYKHKRKYAETCIRMQKHTQLYRNLHSNVQDNAELCICMCKCKLSDAEIRINIRNTICKCQISYYLPLRIFKSTWHILVRFTPKFDSHTHRNSGI